jgi:chromosome segregation ATPase
MNRAVSNYTESTVNEEDILTQELARRQREYRTMENEKNKKCMEMENLIQKQNKAIKQLESEETEIATEMKLASSLKNRKQDSVNTREIQAFTSNKEDYTSLIEKEKELIKEVDKEIAEIEQKIQRQRKAMGGVHNSHLRHFTTQHTIKVLENRLDKATREYNGLTADNRKLREEIQHFRNQRGVFETQYKRLRKDIKHKKHDQNLLIEQSALAYDQRDEATQKMTALKERDTKNVAHYQMEYKELLRQLDHDKVLKKFLLAKAEERWEQAEEKVQQRQQIIEDRCEETAKTKLNEYEQALSDVKTITGATEPDEIIEKFTKMEDKNFALFNYVNEVNNQLQKHDDQIKLLDRDIQQCVADSEVMLQKKIKTIDVETAELESVTKQMEASDNNLKQTNEVLNKLKQGIQTIFDGIGCKNDAMTNRLGEETGVTNVNVLQYLSEIQDQTNELLQQFMMANIRSENDTEQLMNTPTVAKPCTGISAPETEADGATKEPSEEETVHDLRTLRRIALQNCKTREDERKNITTDNKHPKNRKK